MERSILSPDLLTNARTSAEAVRAIRSAYSSDEMSNLDVVAFLDRAVDPFIPEARRICSSMDEISHEDRNALFRHGVLIAAEMIILCEMRSVQRLRDRALLFLELASASVSTPYPLVEKAVQVIGHDITFTGMTWPMLERATSLDVLSYHFCNSVRFYRGERDFSFAGKGIVEYQEGKIVVSPSEKAEADAFDVFGGSVLVRTGRSRGIKLKATERDSVLGLHAFYGNFSEAQKGYAPPKKEVRVPSSGDYVDIEYTGEDDADGYPVMRVIGHEDIRGVIVQEQLVRYVWTDMVRDYLRQDDCILDATLKFDAEGPYFSIAGSYLKFASRRAEAYLRSGRQFEARAVRRFDKWNRIGWLTAAGFGGVCQDQDLPGAQVGMVAVMEVDSVRENGSFINLRPPRGGVADEYDRFKTGDSEGDDILELFVTTRERVLELRGKEKAAAEDDVEREMVERLAMILLARARRTGSLESLRSMMTSSFLFRAVDDAGMVGAIDREIAYRSRIVAYAQGDSLQGWTSPSGLEEGRLHLLACLSSGGGTAGKGIVRGYLNDPDPLCRKVADLLYAGSVSSEFRDEIVTDPDIVRLKVCSLLGVADSFRRVGVSRVGKYGSTERDDMEFKSSYVFRNDNGKPDLDYQGRGQVFEAVCAFMNKDGGTVYVGVNDNGDPIRSDDFGLSADIKWLRENFKMVNGYRARQLGHAIPEVTSIESMSRFLNTEKEMYFPESLQDLIDINPTEDADAIRITVRPSRYEIAYLYSDSRLRTDGIAFVRDGSQTSRMTDYQKRMRLMNIKDISREIGFVVMIKEAIDKHQKLVFRNYASTSSSQVQDRFVVPVNLFYNDENVFCYDLEAKQYRQFRLRRIESVENLEEVYTLPLLPERKCDVFRWMDEGKGSYHIRLRMKVGARNCFLEEYSCAESLPKEEFYKDGHDHWILDTTVYGLGALRRFYLGLADQIEILDSEDSETLKQEIRRFIGGVDL